MRPQARYYRKRVVTAILYLNDGDWDADRDGGELKLYIGAEPSDDVGDTATEVSRAPVLPSLAQVQRQLRVIGDDILPTPRAPACHSCRSSA